MHSQTANVVENTHQGEPVSAWVFDLDGTLSDPLEGMLASINHALESINYQPVSAAQMRLHIGPPLELTLAEFAGTDLKSQITSAFQMIR